MQSSCMLQSCLDYSNASHSIKIIACCYSMSFIEWWQEEHGYFYYRRNFCSDISIFSLFYCHFCCCDKIPQQKATPQRTFILVQSSRLHSITVGKVTWHHSERWMYACSLGSIPSLWGSHRSPRYLVIWHHTERWMRACSLACCAQLHFLTHSSELPCRDWCCLHWAGIPTPMSFIKTILHRHAYRPSQWKPIPHWDSFSSWV